MDRISHLPESIVHHILYYLIPGIAPPVDLVRMSVLSKTWFHLTASFPILVFNFHIFRPQESFFKYVEYATSRFCHQNLTAHKFKLVTTVQNPAEKDVIDRCLELVLKKGVNEMEISIIEPSNRCFCLNVDAVMFKPLTLRVFALPYSLKVDAVMFKSLIRLTLENVRIDDEWIKYLTTSCPLLQELKITSCDGFKSFCVYGHQNLQKLSIDYNTPLEKMDVEAPNLSHLWVDDMCDSGPPQINLVSCKKLTTVAYYGHPLPNDFLSNFPFIENLRLGVTDYKCNNLKLSSHSLRTLVLLQSSCDLNEIELNTPNLVLFVYGSSWAMPDEDWPLLGDSTHLKACMRWYPDGYIDARWLQKLRLFMEKKNGFKALDLYIDTSAKFIELKELNEIKLPPYELEHVELQLHTNKESSNHVAFVAAVLRFFSPQSLTLSSSFPLTDAEEHGDDVVKIISEKLLQQDDQGHTNIQIVSRHEGKTVSFIKKQESG